MFFHQVMQRAAAVDGIAAATKSHVAHAPVIKAQIACQAAVSFLRGQEAHGVCPFVKKRLDVYAVGPRP